MTTAIDKLTDPERKTVAALVSHYQLDIEVYRNLATNLRNLIEASRLSSIFHSLRSRAKDPGHLADKLARKILKANKEGTEFAVTTANLFETINDLAGVRILHLHTSQFEQIAPILTELLQENLYSVVEGPEAKTWDDEYRAYFTSIGVGSVSSERMYTSVHYVVSANTKTRRTAEIQVRTLAEELWGEVDHDINYPHESDKLACREQIKVLARVTSGCTRLVDSIYRSKREP